jgi:hypothetical protein
MPLFPAIRKSRFLFISFLLSIAVFGQPKSEEAMKAFNAQRYEDALAIFKQMLTAQPGDPVLSKFAAESGINAGEPRYAVTLLKPLAASIPDDWQAAILLTRACAESGDTACRDSGMAHILDLHQRGITPRNMQQYILEKIKTEKGTLLIRTSLEPWGYYKVYDLGQLFDETGKIFLRISLESSDDDQVRFAKDHAKEAAEGVRAFSLDAYLETGLNSNGQRTQTHFTYAFLVGQPPYETVRSEFIKIAEGKAKPLSSRTNLVVR